MSGNVWEWTHSLHKPYPYRVDDDRENGKAKSPRVLRGGAFSVDADLARCAYRGKPDPDLREKKHGFRVVVSPREALPD